MNPSDSGARNSDQSTRGSSNDDKDDWATSAISTKCLSRFRANGTFLWRAVDQDGDVIDFLVQRRRNQRAAERFFRRLLKGQGGEARWLFADKLRSYDAAHRTVMPTVRQLNDVYAKNRAEVSHQPNRQRERHMRGFHAPTQAQRLLTLQGITQNPFRLGRHLMQAVNYRLLRTPAFQVWN